MRDGIFGRRLTLEECEMLGYSKPAVRPDDGTVQSMETTNGYRVTYGAPSYSSAVAKADARANESPRK